MSWRFGLVSILLVCLPATAFGQVAITGKITGVVTDSSGAAIPNATVTVRGIALMAVRTTATQPDGSYLFDLLPVGTYDITVAAPGFTTYLQKGVQISAGFTATVNARLHVGEVSAVVTVTGEDPVVDVKSSATPTTFDQNLLQDIPSGRDPWSTVAQAPGTTLSTFDVGGNQSFQQSTMQVHGSKPGEQVYSFNGLRLNWPGSSGGFTAFYIDHDSLQEFQVVTDAAPAEVSVGGIYMNLVTKSGSNQFHGLAAAYYTTSALQSDINLPTFKGAPVNAGTPLVMLRDTTVNGGGPLFRDRWWIFGAYRRYDIREDVLAVRRQFTKAPIQDINHQSDTVLRSDFQINAKNRVNFQWLYNSQNRFFRRDAAFDFVDDTASWRQIEPAYIVQGQWTSVVTNNFIMDARLGYLHLLFPLAYQPTVKPTDINQQDITLRTEKGAAPSNFLNPAQTLRFAASASYYKGAFLGGTHNFKFGYEVGTNRNGNNTDVNGDIRAIFREGQPFQVQVLNTPIRELSIFHDSGFFVQDAWSLPKHVTLNLGLRFDHFRTFNPPQSSPGGGRFVNLNLFPSRSLSQTQEVVSWNNVAPRLGVAYDITGRGRSVVRAGYNRFYLIEGSELAETVNLNTLAGQVFKWDGSVDSNGIPRPNLAPSNRVSSFGGVVTRIDPQIERPYSDQVNVGYEQQVYRDLHVGVSYFYRVNKRQISRRNMAILASDYTPIASIGGNPITNPLTGQPMTLFNVADKTKVGQTDFLVTNVPALDDNAYHGIEFTAIKRFSNKWQLLAGFTIQRAKGIFSSRLGDDFNNPNRDINRRDSNLDFDSTYVFKLDGTYNWPYGFASSVNFQHYTGYPLQPRNVFTGLNQQSETVVLQPRGELRLPSVNLLNLRISRPINIREDRYKLEPIVDLLNLTNSNAVVRQVEAFGLNFLKPVDVLNPFVARFGMRVTF